MAYQNRGMLTDRIKKRSIALLGYEINQQELRLMPYILYTMMNEQKIDPQRLNVAERNIFIRWKTEGRLYGGMIGLTIEKKFWKAITELVYLGYVDLKD